jgi:HSP20 family protein
VPAVNISETNEEFFIELAAPGFKKEELKIKVDNNLLTISSEKATLENSERKFSVKEFNFGSFERVFILAETIDTVKISASFENGILKLTLSKKEEAKPKPARLIEVS